MRRRRKKLPEGLKQLQRLRREGTDLVEARCDYVEACGGCTWQEVRYERQLELKRAQVIDALQAAGLLDSAADGGAGVEVAPTLPSPEVFGYRNKMEFTCSDRRFLTGREISSGADLRRDFALGLFGPNTHYKVIDVAGCPLQTDAANRMLAATRAWALERGHPPWRADQQTGLLRYLVLRHARATGQTLALLVTGRRDPALMQDYADWLAAAGAVPTVVANGVIDSPRHAHTGMEVFVDRGPACFEDELCGLRFRLAPDAFFQVNPLGAERLVEVVLAQAGLEGDERVADLYCGAGTLSLPLAQRAREVMGYEVAAPSIESARENAALNGISNARFAVADLNRGLPRELLEAGADVVVTDPPRPGMHPRVLRDLLRLGARRIVSVGCKPGPQAENLAALCAEGYRLVRVQPLDLFPHAPHVEAVALLQRR